MTKNNNRLITYYIYEIISNVDGRTYIGQRQCPERKTPWTDTKYIGSGKYIRNAESKYGIENFSKKILAICHDVKIIDILEIEYIKMYKEIGKAEFNIAGGGQTRCREYMTEDEIKSCNEHISKGIRNSEKWRKAMTSDEHRRKMSEVQKGRVSPTKGKKYSKEHCEKLSKSIKELYNSSKGEEIKNKIRAARAEQVFTEEAKRKMSESHKGKIVSVETREKLRQVNLGRVVSKETKDKIREARMKQTFTEESKQKRLKSIKEFWISSEGLAKKKELSEKGKLIKKPKGMHWFTNGIINIRAKECPEGFRSGRTGDFTCSEEAKRKKSEWYKNLSDEERAEYKKHLSQSHIGHHFTEEQKKHIGDGNRGRKYFNNGEIEVMRYECPPGFVPGRCPKARAAIKSGMTQ